MALRRTLLVRQRFIPVTPRPCAYMKPFLAMDSFLESSRNDYISNSPLLSLIVISIEARMNLMIPWKLGSICSFHGISNHQTSPTSNFHGNGVLCFTPVKEYNYSVESDFLKVFYRIWVSMNSSQQIPRFFCLMEVIPRQGSSQAIQLYSSPQRQNSGRCV